MQDIIQENAIESRLMNKALLKTTKTIILYIKTIPLYKLIAY